MDEGRDMFKSMFVMLKDAGVKFWNDRGPRMGAALAFYSALSISPLLLLVIGIAGLVFGQDAARGALFEQLNGLIGPEGAQSVETMVAHSREPAHGVWATVVGIVTLIIGATGVFAELQDQLNTVWNVQNASPGQSNPGWFSMAWGVIRDRFLSFSMICGMAFLLLVSLVFSAVLHALQGWILGDSPETGVLMHLANLLVTFLLTTLMFAMIFRLLPNTTVAWSDVWIGAGLTAVFFTVGKFLIGLYLGNAAVGSTFGAAGSFVVLLVWIYYSTQILIYGAEFTQIYADRMGSSYHDRQRRSETEDRLPASTGQKPGPLVAAARPYAPSP